MLLHRGLVLLSITKLHVSILGHRGVITVWQNFLVLHVRSHGGYNVSSVLCDLLPCKVTWVPHILTNPHANLTDPLIVNIIVLVVAETYCSIKPGFEWILMGIRENPHQNPLKTGLNATVCRCNNKCSFGGSVICQKNMFFVINSNILFISYILPR